jgi:hypothetical protein
LIELLSPEFLIAVEPIIGVTHWFRPQAAAHDAAILLTADEPGIREHIKVLHDGWQRHRKRLGEFAHGEAVSVAQPGKQCTPRRVGKRRKGAIKAWLVIVNHMVKYRTASAFVKPVTIYLSLTKSR